MSLAAQLRIFVLAVAGVLGGCAGYGVEPPGAQKQAGQVCSEGDRRVCACGGGSGTQVCKAGGDGFDGCICDVDVPDGGIPGMGGAPPSGCGTCDGCCRGDTCVPLEHESDAACGKRGQECRACDAGGVCDNDTGSCVTPTAGVCNRATCPTGCCSPTGCVTDQSWSACGVHGDACQTCALGGTLCEGDGTCRNNFIDDQEYFYLSVRSIQVEKTTSLGSYWDLVPFHTDPEPLACLSYDDIDDRGQTVRRSACTKSCTDTTTCELTQADGLLKYCYALPTCWLCSSPKTVCDPILFHGSALRGGAIHVVVQDYDSTSGNDLIGEANLPPTSNLTTARYRTGSFGSVAAVEYEILYSLP